ncbi:FecR family protein [Chitinophaga niastensis]|uniref:FecR family protein n=1 Tax=Chitinophaga niastensis TaxID=536980 RepID=A0A2P8HJ00_CHINA|nr:FecR family protein [Chitinophaga niastensis]PSL46187.1 FecR family protein [Chitinophaga niastensis]
MEQTELDCLLNKYKAGKCSEEEIMLLFMVLDRIAATTATAGLSATSQLAVQKAVFAHVHTVPVTKWHYIRRWMAAAIILPACIGGYWWQQHSHRSKAPAITWIKLSTGAQEIRHVQLPDGTLAWLNAASTLEYPQQFNGSERLVKVNGQVFFDVHQNREQPFTVQSGELRVNVLGTAFLIRNVAGQPTRVAVASGKVQVTHNKKILGTLLPADQLTYTNKRTTISKTDTTAISSWTKGELIINNATLQQVLWELETFYGVQFHSKFNLEQGHLNVSFSNGMSLQNKLDIIATISIAPKVHFREKGKGIFEVYQ